MKNDKWLYFRTVADEANDDGDLGSSGIQPGSICIPASSVIGMRPASDTSFILDIDPIIAPLSEGSRLTQTGGNADTITFTCTQGKTFECMAAISQAISEGGNAYNDGFIVVFDDMTTTDSATTALNDLTVSPEYLHPDITAGGNIIVNPTRQGTGVHEYFEVVTPMTADDDDVAASLSISLPADCVILDAALIPITLATSNHGLVALEVHNAAIADDAASGGTEIVGADVSGNTSSPDEDVDLSSDADKAAVHMGSLLSVDRQNAVTFFHVTAKEDMSSMTGSPTVGVYVKWIGGAAVTA
jgi:hypothetical protein